MKLNSDDNVLAENKVLILYVLNKLSNPITDTGLLKTITTVQEINYFYFQQFLLDLIEIKYIACYEKENSKFYEITNSGKNALKLTTDLVPGIIKFKIDNSLQGNLETIENQASITAEYIPQNEKEYIVKCKINENGTTLFELQAFAGSRESAKKITENWQNNANSLYPQILDILINN